MKRRTILTIMMLALGVVLSLGLSACGDSSDMQYKGLNLDDYLTVGEYKGLEVDGYKIKVSEQEIQDKVDEALEAATENDPLPDDAELEDGDTANIDYSGEIDGKEFEGGSQEGFDLVLGSGSFIDGFEDGLIGKKIGDEVKLNLTFPKDYSGKEVAGKDVVFTVKINSATRPKKPEYTEDFVKANTDYKTKEEYEESLKKEIYDSKEEQAKNEQKMSLWSDVLDSTKVTKYPETEMAAYKEVFSAQVDTMAEQAGMERADVLKQYYGAEDEESFDSIIEDSVKTLIKQELLVEYIADKEGLEYTDEEKEKLISDLEGQGYTEETVKSYTGRDMEQYAHIELLYEKVQDFLLENAKVKAPKK